MERNPEWEIVMFVADALPGSTEEGRQTMERNANWENMPFLADVLPRRIEKTVKEI